jgi:secreted PhoX family phosphatase
MYSFCVMVLNELHELSRKVNSVMNPEKLIINLNGKLWIKTDKEEDSEPEQK